MEAGCYLFQLIIPLFVKITILSKDIIFHHSYDFMVSFCMVQMIISMASPSFNLNNKNAPQLAKKKKREINLFVLLLFQCKNSSLAADLCEQEKNKDEDRVETSQKVGRETHILL